MTTLSRNGPAAQRVGSPPGPAPSPVPAFDLLESKLQPPRLLAGSVPRTSLLELLEASSSIPVVLLSAAPGYGKTTLLAEWAARSRRPFAWVSVDEGDNDPIVLLTYIAAALDRLSPLEPSVFDALASPGVSIEAMVVPRLAAALAATEPSFVLVLDDLQALNHPPCLDALDTLIDHVPGGSQLVLSGQLQPSRRVGALRARGLALEIGPDDLRMAEGDARELLRAAGVELTDDDVAALVERTEGWPAGLYLAGLSIRAGENETRVATTVRGDDRFIADFLRSELFSRLAPSELRFLTRTSVLERLSAPLCNAVLKSSGSAPVLESLERSNLFVVPLDPNREWYRYHHLFRELLHAELERAEPDLVPELLARASDWCDAGGEPEMAVAYAQAAGDADRVAGVVEAHAQRQYQLGRAVTVEGWLDWLERHGAPEQNPLIAVLGAWFSAIRGQSDRAERWTDIAERAALEGTAPDRGHSVEPWLALLRAVRCQRGVEKMRSDAELALRSFERSGPFWLTAAVVLALSRLLSGDDAGADDLFADVAESGQATGGWNGASLALAERAALAIERDEWVEAGALADQAQSIVRRSRMEEYPPNGLVFAVSARVAIHRRETPRATELLARAQRLRPRLTHVLATLSIQTRLQLASAYLALADAAGARTQLREADGLLRRGPDFGTLARQAEDLRSKLETVHAEAPGASTLTTAELRLLPLLTTHLSFREIGERLYLSRHTVKSHAMAIYRKLDVTSRTAAVERARDLGMV
jgi:LuxR family transcriptional regulator, maltose regulon positive regulatory protein